MNQFTTRAIKKNLLALPAVLVIAVSTLAISACGQKGPLKLPDEPAKPATKSHNHADK